MKDIYILGIETSCDETSCSIVKNGITEIATVISTQIDIHKKYGGVVPEIASRNHIVNITMVIEETFNKCNITIKDISAIAVTYGPGLSGSLLIGLEAAKTLSFIYNIPLVPVHHIAGHIYANNLIKPLTFPLLALVVSGGHTDLILMKDHLKFHKIGGTLDDAIGECYDKVARVIGIEYPGGPIIDKLAINGHHTYQLPTPLNDDSYNFSFSGLKSAVINLAHNLKQKNEEIIKEDLATSFQEVVVDIIAKKTFKALENYDIKNLVVAGGVAANNGLRNKLTKLAMDKNINLIIPNINYCTDNATMIATVGYYYFINNKISELKVDVKSSEELKDII